MSLIKVSVTLLSGGLGDLTGARQLSPEAMAAAGHARVWMLFTSLPRDRNQRKLCTEMSHVNCPWWCYHVM